MNEIFLIAIVVLVFVVIFQIAKASEYVSILKGEEKARKQTNRINGFMLVAFLILGLIGVWWCNDLYYGKTLFPQGSASIEGEDIDRMLLITTAVCGVVFFLTQVLLFWFAFRYQESDKRRAYFFTHDNKLELIWTSIPAIVLTVLVVIGLKYWFQFTSDAPENAQKIEVTGHQFGWEFRYPGKDKILGKKNFKMTNPELGNPLGVDWNDPTSHDDIHVATIAHMVVNKPVKLIIHSQDVIHDVGLPHFRMKMDAVPGIPTTLWFTPKYTTREMKAKTQNQNFVYELACDQMCGRSHYSMRGEIIVETQQEFDAWIAQQKSEHSKIGQGNNPSVNPKIDSTTIAAPVAQVTKK